jgi:hypothetical protein
MGETLARKKKKETQGRDANAGRVVAAAAAAVEIVRVARTAGPPAAARAAAPVASPEVPVASIDTNGGPVTVGITFGQAQHAKYTIQLFDPIGTTELTRQSGINTDAIPDQFTLQATPAQLDQNILQWSGLISAFSPAPGQMFSVTFEVTQGGVAVPGGRVPRTGALTVAQPFIGVLRLVTR